MFSTRLRGFRKSLSIGGVTLGLVCGYPGFAFGQIVADWIGPSGGAWSNTNNWSCVEAGSAFNCVPNSITNPGTTFTVNIDNNQAVLDTTVEVDGVALGVLQSDLPGSLSVGGTTLTVDSELDAGVLIPGNLSITGGGVVNDNKATIAVGAGSGGSSVTVSGTSSQWNTTDELVVGFDDVGSLTIQSGAVVSSGSDGAGAFLGGSHGNGTTGVGTAIVTGAGSQWNIGGGCSPGINGCGGLFVGWPGRGTLTISGGGQVNDVQGVISNQLGAVGTATVTGKGSQWNNSQLILVGSANGNGTLTVSNGGVVTDIVQAAVGVGSNQGGVGTATVIGTGSQWNSTGQMLVGVSATGTLNVKSGGVVTSGVGTSGSTTSGVIGTNGGMGKVLVTGTGSQWNQDGALRVGFNSPGTLTISRGGAVNDAAGFIGYQSGSTGAVEVSGGSVWNNTNSLDVGVGGPGTLTVGSGSLVTAGSYTQNLNGKLNINLARKAIPGQINITGTGSASLNGTLNIVLQPGFVPALGSTFQILTAGSVTSTFSTVNGTSINSSEHFVVQYNSNNVSLRVVAGTS